MPAVFALLILIGFSLLVENPLSTCVVIRGRDVTFQKISKIDILAVDDDVTFIVSGHKRVCSGVFYAPH